VRVLLIDDDPDSYALVRTLLALATEQRFEIDWVDTLDEAMRTVERRAYDVYLVDYRFGGQPVGLDFIGTCRERGFREPMILLTAQGDRRIDERAIQVGAADYLDKLQLETHLLERSIRHAIERTRTLEALRQSEAQLRQSQKLEAVGRLAGGVAHDFNNLLTAITGHSEFLLRRIEKPDPLFFHAEGIRRAASRAAALTRQLLAFSRKQVLEPRVLDLNAIVSDLEKMLKRIIGEDVRFVTTLAPALGHVEADPGQIEQVIVNLVVNARDAMAHGGTLEIRTRNVTIDDRAGGTGDLVPGDYVELAVADTGLGMDAEMQARIFEPFFTTKPQGKGTGLGLSIVYGIVAQSGGAIVVASQPGRGSTFSVFLPRVKAELDDDDEADGDRVEPLRGTETVLLVEDDSMVREVARRVLQMNGYFVLEVNQASEAIAVCRRYKGRIHLMLTDVVMPGMSGRELAEHVATIRSDMRVLYMSGYLDDEIDNLGVPRESERFIAKPFLPNELVLKIRKILDA
jgi:signal transduction histidine kinase